MRRPTLKLGLTFKWRECVRPELRFLFQAFSRYSHLFWLLVFLLILAAMFDVGFILAIKHLIDQSIHHQALLAHWAFYAFMVVLGLGLTRELLSFMQKFVLSKLSNHVGLGLKRAVIKKLLVLDFEHLQRYDPGYFTTQLQVNIETLRVFGNQSLVAFFRESVTLCGSVIAITLIHLKLTLLFTLAVPPAYYFSRYFSKKIKKYSSVNLQTQRDIVNAVLDARQNFVQIKLRQLQQQMALHCEDALLDNYTANHHLNIKAAQLTFMIQMAVMFVFALTIYLLFSGKMGVTVGILSAFVYCFARVRGPIKALTNLKAEYERTCVSIHALENFFALPAQAIDENTAFIDEPITAIGFKNISFGYHHLSHPLFEKMTLAFKVGQPTALIGASGTGKSSLLYLMCALCAPTMGSMVINDQPFSAWSRHHYQQRIAYVSQRSSLFSHTLRFNLTMGCDQIDDERCLEMLKNLSLDSWFKTLTNGLDTPVGESSSVQMSGGQIQRVCLGRALLSDFDVLLLDEAFSGIDATMADSLQHMILNRYANKIIVAITHQYRSIHRYDRVLALKAGQIHDCGQLLNASEAHRVLHDHG